MLIFPVLLLLSLFPDCNFQRLSKCKEDYHFNTYNRRCLSCKSHIFPKNCKTCDYTFSGFKCKSCTAPYLLTEEQTCELDCKKLISDPFCRECGVLRNGTSKDEYFCRECEAGYGPNEEGVCIKCSNDCFPCCNKCPENLLPREGGCFDCQAEISLCIKCIAKVDISKANICLECESPFSPNFSKEKCESCPEKTGIAKCIKCRQTDTLEWNCEKCDAGFLYFNGSCELCPVLNNCVECKSRELCYSCSNRYYLVVTNELSCSKCENPLYQKMNVDDRDICVPFPKQNPNILFKASGSKDSNLFFAEVNGLCFQERDWENKLKAFFVLSNNLTEVLNSSLETLVNMNNLKGDYYFEEDGENFKAIGSVENADGNAVIIIPRKNFYFGWFCQNHLNLSSKTMSYKLVEVEGDLFEFSQTPTEVLVLTTFANFTDITQLACNLAEAMQISPKRVFINEMNPCPIGELNFSDFSYFLARNNNRALNRNQEEELPIIINISLILKMDPEYRLYSFASYNSTYLFKIKASLFEPFIFTFQGDTLPRWNKMLDVRWWLINKNSGVDPLAQNSFFINKSISTNVGPPKAKLQIRSPLHLRNRFAFNLTVDEQCFVFIAVTGSEREDIKPSEIMLNETEGVLLQVVVLSDSGSVPINFNFPKKGEYNVFYFSKAIDQEIFSPVQRLSLEVYLYSAKLFPPFIYIFIIALIYPFLEILQNI